MCKVSVITPVYKVEKYLGKCIDSILNQSFKDFELIIVDDGSPDSCGKIADEYEKIDSRVKVIHKENGGAPSARNAGIEIAKGEYFYFPDSDDWLDPEYLQELVVLAEKTHAELDAYFNYSLGNLEYRSVRFETEVLNIPNFQGNAAVNYTDAETPWTRIIEHKWFEFGKDEEGNYLPKTVISREYSSEWKPGDEPYYPVNDEKNGNLYAQYKLLADKEQKVIFGGRLGEYRYYDMDQVIESALRKSRELI